MIINSGFLYSSPHLSTYRIIGFAGLCAVLERIPFVEGLLKRIKFGTTLLIINMDIQNVEPDFSQADRGSLREELQPEQQFGQVRYRWVMIAFSAALMMLNGLLNNIIIPLETKLAVIYDKPYKVVNMITIISFLLFTLMNVPANYILDLKGIRIGFLIGITLYLAGMVMACFVNVAFGFLLAGYLVFTLGQPFILNTPAKIATYWFFPKNRALPTSILVGANIIGSGLGFAIPTLVVKEDSETNIAKHQISSLYIGYTITNMVLLAGCFLLIRARPSIPASNIDHKQQLSFKQTFNHIKQDRNLWKFLAAYFLIYGSFQTFASSANFLIKPFGYTDLQISVAAILLIIFGSFGAILSSLYLNRTQRYKRTIMICLIGACSTLILFGFQLNLVPTVYVMVCLLGLMGFFVVPIIPLSYQIGCEVAFPIGEAQITGLLNGGSLIWAFIADSILTAAVGFGSKAQSTIFLFIVIIIIMLGTVLYFFVAINLKRKHFEDGEDNSNNNSSPDRLQNITNPQQMELTSPIKLSQNRSTSDNSEKGSKYNTLNEQKSA